MTVIQASKQARTVTRTVLGVVTTHPSVNKQAGTHSHTNVQCTELWPPTLGLASKHAVTRTVHGVVATHPWVSKQARTVTRKCWEL